MFAQETLPHGNIIVHITQSDYIKRSSICDIESA